jgi:methylphosphotriester-DNA--protein-cysteine methyltransferase
MSITSTVVSRAEIRFVEAAEPLRRFVGCFWVVTAGCGATIRVVPDGSSAIGITSPDTNRSGWTLRGPLLRPDERRFDEPSVMVGIRLLPGVAHLLSGVSAQALLGRRIRATDLPAFRDLAAASSFRTAEETIDALQTFLRRRLAGAQLHPVVATAISEIERGRGRARVEDVARLCGVSARHLNRLMRVWVGYGPKAFATVVRFQQTLKQMERAPARSGAALASDTGYFDQAHLTLDLTRFAGATPGRLSNGVADFSKTYCEDVF